jgi:hypothetical protein
MTNAKHILILSLSLLLLLSSAFAKEGSDQSNPGPESWAAGAAPPPGLYYLNYLGGYTGKLKDGSGNNVMLGSATPSVDVVFNCSRFVFITPFKVLGANVGMHTIIPVVSQNVDMGGSKSMTSIGDIDFNPFYLAWHTKKNIHIMSGVDFYAPTGHYNKNDARTSVGANTWLIEPQLIISYFNKSGWETSGRVMYNFKTTNQATQYHSGQDFHFDYLVGKHFGPLGLGASGYALKQTTNDTVSGVTVPAASGFWSEGRKGQVFAIGPSVEYTTKNHIMIIGQWQHEAAVRNRFGGDKYWFRLIVPTADLFGKKKA